MTRRLISDLGKYPHVAVLHSAPLDSDVNLTLQINGADDICSWNVRACVLAAPRSSLLPPDPQPPLNDNRPPTCVPRARQRIVEHCINR